MQYLIKDRRTEIFIRPVQSTLFQYTVDRAICTRYKSRSESRAFKDARSVFYTLIISHKSGKMLSILINITLQKDLQNFVTNNLFMDKK